MATQQAAGRRESLARARLYLVVDAAGAGDDLGGLLRAAARGGVDIVQLREKHLSDDELVAAGSAARAVCAETGMLFILNDRPDLARAIDADGVHVGQDDMPPAQARAIVGPDALVGLSTHAPGEVDAADPGLVDYIGVGPVHETPTKPGRPAVGAALVRHAAASARVPFFAIGGLHAGNLGEVLDAGATRVCVLRAIGASSDPEGAARQLAALLAGAGKGTRTGIGAKAGNDMGA